MAGSDLEELEPDGEGFESVLPEGGIETPASTVDLRKAEAPAPPGPAPQLFHVLERQTAQIGTQAFMGSDHRYVVPPSEQPMAQEAAAPQEEQPPAAPAPAPERKRRQFKF